MEERRFDQLTKELAAPVTRRGALKALAAAALGGVLAQLKGGSALAQTTTGCPPRTVPCNGQCVGQCCPPGVLNPKTCLCGCRPHECPPGMFFNVDTCQCQCLPNSQICHFRGATICCPPPKHCDPKLGCVCPPKRCPPGYVHDPTTCDCVCAARNKCVNAAGVVTCCAPPLRCVNGVCVCPNGTAPCINSTTNLARCCPAGTTCIGGSCK